MSFKIVFDRLRSSKCSIPKLMEHLDYLGDEKDPDHAGMTLLSGTNYNCDGPDAADFVKAVEETKAIYKAARTKKNGKGKKGKRSPLLWEEFIYSPEIGTFTTTAERAEIEKKIIAELAPDSAARLTWHLNLVTGHDDLHILVAAKTKKGKMTTARTTVSQSKRMYRLDQEFVDMLNANPNKPENRIPLIRSSAEVAAEESAEIAKSKKRPKPIPLKQQVANLTDEEVTADMLPGLLRQLGIVIKTITEKTIVYISTRMRQSGTARVPREPVINVEDFLLDVLEIQIDRKLAKFAALKAFLEARTGKTTVDSRTLEELTKTTKNMLTKKGRIKRNILETFSAEEQAQLAPLITEYLILLRYDHH